MKDPTDLRGRKLIIKCDNCKRPLSAHSKRNFCPIEGKVKNVYSAIGNKQVVSKEKFRKDSKFKLVYGANILSVCIIKDFENNQAIFKGRINQNLFTFPLDALAKTMIRYPITFAQIYFLGVPESIRDVRILKFARKAWYGFYE